MKSKEEIRRDIAQKHRLGDTLVTGHMAKYWEEYADVYAYQQTESLRQENERLKAGEWISVEDEPLFIETRLGWQTTNSGSGTFIAAVPTNEGWWIRLCIIEDEIGLTVMGESDNEPAGYTMGDITHYKLVGEPLS